MKLTKFTHSCVLVEHEGLNVLFDPGVFSWQSGLVDLDSFPNLDQIIISHKHGDHMAEPFVRALVARFPGAQWIAPSDAFDDLKSFGVLNITNLSSDNITVIETNHAPVEPFGVQVKNLIVDWKDIVTMPGDTHDIKSSKQILLLPMQAPWGTTVRALQLPPELGVKYVVPIHDWMWNEAWRQNCYDRFETVLAQNNIMFLRPKDGEPLQITV